jgi:sodium/hydrogen exchanger family protein
VKTTHPTIVRLYWLAALLALVVAGYVLGRQSAPSTPGLLIAALLVIGLYAAASGIDLKEAWKNRRLVGLAITIGVIAKAIIIGGVCWLLTGSPTGLIAGVVFSQIDPLSVSALRKSFRMSPRAKHVIALWATFDDPISVLLSQYLLPFTVGLAGSIALTAMSGSLIGWGGVVIANLAVAVITYTAWCATKHLRHSHGIELLILAAVMAVAICFSLVLSIAITGLFLRPLSDKLVERGVLIAYGLSAMLIGTLLIHGVNLGLGALVGIVAYATHYVVSEVLTRQQNLDPRDRLHLGLGQQSGITACNLILLFAAAAPEMVAICAPALVVVNTLHLAANALLDWREMR